MLHGNIAHLFTLKSSKSYSQKSFSHSSARWGNIFWPYPSMCSLASYPLPSSLLFSSPLIFSLQSSKEQKPNSSHVLTHCFLLSLLYVNHHIYDLDFSEHLHLLSQWLNKRLFQSYYSSLRGILLLELKIINFSLSLHYSSHHVPCNVGAHKDGLN